MKKSTFFVLATTIFTLTTSSAAVYKGQRIFKKECMTCHKDGAKFVASHNAKYWKDITLKDGAPLKKLHEKETKAKASLAYFNSKKYTKKLKHLREFLVKYAKGSGNVPVLH
ncbi:hypothetical protein MNB_SM-3-780 [hydrothermal vent metagenome]|uniref:Cytochrome c domain-containing protein n=1 Tax=hydrothermal vent metagenome TaxID=652676 RepID=A0A1W1D480_9ZZZZ